MRKKSFQRLFFNLVIGFSLLHLQHFFHPTKKNNHPKKRKQEKSRLYPKAILDGEIEGLIFNCFTSIILNLGLNKFNDA